MSDLLPRLIKLEHTPNKLVGDTGIYQMSTEMCCIILGDKEKYSQNCLDVLDVSRLDTLVFPLIVYSIRF